VAGVRLDVLVAISFRGRIQDDQGCPQIQRAASLETRRWRIKMPRSHRCSEGLGLNQRQQFILAYRRFDFQAITGRRDLHLI